MFAGLPGIGIGGIFYMLLAGILLVRAVWHRLTNAGRPRWSVVAVQTSMVVAMGLVLAFEGEAVIWSLRQGHVLEPATLQTKDLEHRVNTPARSAVLRNGEIDPNQEEEVRRYLPTFPYLSLAILATVLTAVSLAALSIRKPLAYCPRPPVSFSRHPQPVSVEAAQDENRRSMGDGHSIRDGS